jgi:hypothetical protein
MAKGTVVRGTPVNHISADNGQGFTSAGKPAGFQGTVNGQFAGDQSQQPNPKSGTPLQSRSVNDDLQKSHPVARNGGNFLNDADALKGVVFGGVASSRDNIPTPADVMDSPVPAGAQRPDTDSQAKLNALRNGQGKDYNAEAAIPDHFNGVMSR